MAPTYNSNSSFTAESGMGNAQESQLSVPISSHVQRESNAQMVWETQPSEKLRYRGKRLTGGGVA
jgi:hypothetical protein